MREGSVIRKGAMKAAMLAGALGLGGGLFAASTGASAPQLLTINPAESRMWLTAFGDSYDVALDYPAGATAATILVTDEFGYSKSYTDLTGARCAVALPAPTAPRNERVYTITVTYSDSSTQSVKVGRVCAAALGGAANGARCIMNADWAKWGRTQNAVLPVPSGATLSVNGAAVETGLGGKCGWYQLVAGVPGTEYTLLLKDANDPETVLASAELNVHAEGGMQVYVK